MNSTKYVVVYNTKYPIPTRHIITYNEYESDSDFWEWYYSVFSRLDGDEMRVFDNITEALKFSNNL